VVGQVRVSRVECMSYYQKTCYNMRLMSSPNTAPLELLTVNHLIPGVNVLMHKVVGITPNNGATILSDRVDTSSQEIRTRECALPSKLGELVTAFFVKCYSPDKTPDIQFDCHGFTGFASGAQSEIRIPYAAGRIVDALELPPAPSPNTGVTFGAYQATNEPPKSVELHSAIVLGDDCLSVLGVRGDLAILENGAMLDLYQRLHGGRVFLGQEI